MEEKKEFELFIKPTFKKFYSEDSSYGIYTVMVTDDSPNQDRLDIDDMFREITLVGNMPELEVSNTYVVKVSETRHKVYGIQYEVKTIYQKLFSTWDEQVTFLKTIITDKQLESLTSAYPNEDLIKLIKNDNIDVSLVKGIGEKTLESIKRKIVENERYQVVIVELTGKFGIPFNAVKRLSDRYGSPELLLQKINENPYLLTEVDGFGFKRVDEIALAMGVNKKSPNRILACIIYVLNEQANNGHCWVKYTKAVSEAIKLLDIKISDVEEVLNSDEFVLSGVTMMDGKMYLDKYYHYEKEIHRNIQRLLSSSIEYKVPNIEETIKRVEESQGFKFTEEQLKAINYAVEHNIVIVNGRAGTGKTSVIKGIVEVLSQVDGLEYATCALSGKASQRIQESTGLTSYTIHRLLGFNPYGGWEYDEENKLGQDVIILDEASMVNSQLFYFLIRAIKNGAKLIITGDTAQLEPIGVGNVLVDLLESEYVPSVELTIVHRQAQKSGILSCANLVRDGKTFIDNNDYSKQRLGELKDLYMYPYGKKENVYKAILQIAKQYNEDIMDFQVLVPMKSRGDLSTKNLNKELQIIFNQDPEFVDKRRKIVKNKVTFLEGDKVIINGNNYDKEIFNGTMGVIEFIDSTKEDEEIVINFDGVGRISFTSSEMNQIDLGYAITTHKSQGSQWKYVVLGLDYASWVLLNRQLTYTGMTRAKEALFMVVELKALQHAIKTDNSSKRNTFLPELLSAK